MNLQLQHWPKMPSMTDLIVMYLLLFGVAESELFQTQTFIKIHTCVQYLILLMNSQLQHWLKTASITDLVPFKQTSLGKQIIYLSNCIVLYKLYRVIYIAKCLCLEKE